MKVNILGTEYTIIRATEADDGKLKNADGYCDDTVKKIVVESNEESSTEDKEDLHAYYRGVIRHEIIHAFLSESGLSVSSGWAVNEEIVDWIAQQFPKMQKVFEELGCEG